MSTRLPGKDSVFFQLTRCNKVLQARASSFRRLELEGTREDQREC
jgi:hypothetical protein